MPSMSAQEFFAEYIRASNTHDFFQVEKFIAKDATYWFSNGTYVGLAAVKSAFVSTWEKIEDETYSVHNLKWIVIEEASAVCAYTYKWKGIIEGVAQEGEGRGTDVLVKRNSNWLIIHEHLSKKN